MLQFIPFFLTLSGCIYSLINLFQYILDRLCTTFCLCWLSISFLYISTTLCAFKDCPDIKWFGVNTVKSSVLSLIDVKGLLLVVPSIWTRVVINWSLLVDYLSLISMPFFVTFTNAFQAPPIHGLLGGMKCHWVFWIEKLLIVAVWSKFFNKNFNSWFAPTKYWPLSLHMLLGLPCLDVNLCNAIIMQSVLKSPAKCIDLYIKHVKYLLSVPVLALVHFPLLMVIGLK